MSDFSLDRALLLEPHGDGSFLHSGENAYWNFTSAFGGWVLSLAVKAVRDTGLAEGQLLSIGALFMSAVPAEPLLVEPELLRKSATTQFWRVAIRRASDAAKGPLFSADIVLSRRRPSEIAYLADVPEVSEPAACSELDTNIGPAWLKHYSQRSVSGEPFSVQDRPENIVWLSEKDARPWDELGLVAASDTPMPRVFFADTTPRFGATISYGLHLFGLPDHDDPTQPILVAAGSDAIINHTYDQQGRIWSRSGRMLATTWQIGAFRS